MVHIRREIEIMSSLRHPHIISIYEGKAAPQTTSEVISILKYFYTIIYTHTYSQFRATNLPQIYVFGLWEEAEDTRQDR